MYLTSWYFILYQLFCAMLSFIIISWFIHKCIPQILVNIVNQHHFRDQRGGFNGNEQGTLNPCSYGACSLVKDLESYFKVPLHCSYPKSPVDYIVVQLPAVTFYYIKHTSAEWKHTSEEWNTFPQFNPWSNISWRSSSTNSEIKARGGGKALSIRKVWKLPRAKEWLG